MKIRKNISSRITLFVFFNGLLICGLFFSLFNARAGTVTPDPSFNANLLISDNDLINTGSMTPSKIQAFLKSKGSVLATISPSKLCRKCVYNAEGDCTKVVFCTTNTKNAAQLIYEAAVVKDVNGDPIGVNPGVILVTLQKEQSMITRTTSTQFALDWAMGYGSYESGDWGSEYAGFNKQVMYASKMLRYNYKIGRGPSNYYLGDSFRLSNTTGYYDVPASQVVKPVNKATMPFYRYTPHVFNGNYNFWLYWNRWKSWYPSVPKIGIWNFISSGAGVQSYKKAYLSAKWKFDYTKFSHGDVNGDGREDIIAIYSYRPNQMGVWVFKKTDAGYSAEKWWLSCRDCWKFSNTNLQVGDVNNDGKDDIILVYNYGWRIGVWNLISNGNGITSMKRAYLSGKWNLKSSRFSSGDVNGDNKDDLVAIYDYGSSTTGLWVFEKRNTGYALKRWWRSCAGCWSVFNTNLQVGDVNNNGRDDMILTYNQKTTIAVWNFISSGTALASKSKIYTSGNWNFNKTKFASGDINGDNKDDLVVIYDYGSSTTGLWVFEKTDAGYSAEKWWQSVVGKWAWYLSNLQAGDVDNDGNSDIIINYSY